jgi:hypothetical protein
MKKILIVLSVIIAWECRDSVVPGIESVIAYVMTIGSSLLRLA